MTAWLLGCDQERISQQQDYWESCQVSLHQKEMQPIQLVHDVQKSAM